ncbi:MAG: cystathionine beta-lyase [Alphaproteobacteria bacterium]|nr:cystathionine beta-lyase [Alphaproteobacteria bacterium]
MTDTSDPNRKNYRPDTKLSVLGRDPFAHHGIVNPPVYHASTVLFPTVAALKDPNARAPGKVFYGRYGTPTTFALEEAVAEIEGGHRAVIVGSGKAAVVCALLAFLKAGDHVLMVDAAYQPSRHFGSQTLARFGIECTFYDPLIKPDALQQLIKPNTRVLYLESPGSLTFEVQDVPALAKVGKGAGLTTMIDNTWASPLLCNPFALGCDVSIQAGTKYVVGHSDAMLGLITGTMDSYPAVRRTFEDLGYSAGPDDIYLALRGLRTLSVRLRRHQEVALELATWLQRRPEVARVLYPALPDDPGHALWKRDYKGASGLFGVVLKPVPAKAVAAMLDGLKLFGMGYSWGGYESLIVPTEPHLLRADPSRWRPDHPMLRIHAGLEDPADLIADLDAGFARLNRAAGR